MFSNNQINQISNNEPEAIRSLSKKKIYEKLAEDYLLPNFSCRAIIRDYLAGVYSNNYFRVGLSEINKFKVDITPRLMKKAVFVDVSQIVQKIDALLKESNRPHLGFIHGYMPDTEWLYQVARFVDPCNAAGIFEHSIRDPTNPIIDSDKVLVAQRVAEKILLADNNLLGKRNVMDSVRDLCETQRKMSCRERKLKLMEVRGIKLMEEIKEGKLEVESKLRVTSLIVRAEVRQKYERDERGISEEEEHRRLLKVKEM